MTCGVSSSRATMITRNKQSGLSEKRLTKSVVLDQRNNLATVSAYFDVWWLDEHLMWNVTDYGGLDRIFVPLKWIWKPEFYMYHSVYGRVPEYATDAPAEIRHDGRVRMFVSISSKSFCPINFKRFPFDSQTCSFSVDCEAALSAIKRMRSLLITAKRPQVQPELTGMEGLSPRQCHQWSTHNMFTYRVIFRVKLDLQQWIRWCRRVQRGGFEQKMLGGGDSERLQLRVLISSSIYGIWRQRKVERPVR
ncbi:unnamed protein product [Nippostrongylus brasiliensis]|uniref:Neur_chan_LBD domain-containing protein n=1 Tax=Nippostrongylus brasiliensis TaxID=27835 RepID=A0A0N4XSX7_NIPBR|nr:unnamed protein product [Nippostrongylus brasiliensis]